MVEQRKLYRTHSCHSEFYLIGKSSSVEGYDRREQRRNSNLVSSSQFVPLYSLTD